MIQTLFSIWEIKDMQFWKGQQTLKCAGVMEFLLQFMVYGEGKNREGQMWHLFIVLEEAGGN